MQQFINPLSIGGMVPSVSAMLNKAVGTEIISSINERWGGGQTFFGSSNDVFANRYQYFLDNVISNCDQSLLAIQTAERMMAPNMMTDLLPLETVEEFADVPSWLMIPILTSPTVRPLFEKGKVHGFGLDPNQDLPEEDFAGRLISNGRVSVQAGGMAPTHFEYHWHDGDPDYSSEVLDVIRQTRKFADAWFKEIAFRPADEEIVDLTNYPNPVGKLIPIETKD